MASILLHGRGGSPEDMLSLADEWRVSGGLIGPPGLVRNDVGSMGGTPVFLGCSDVDPHIPLERVHESAETLRRMGGVVDERIYRGMGHTVNSDEMQAVRSLIQGESHKSA